MEKKLKHLEMIQLIVNRLATNSFRLKYWSVVLVSALFALSSQKTNLSFIYFTYFPVIVFWGLDGYFLSEERKFRNLYDRVRNQKESEIDFSMDAGKDLPVFATWRSAVLSQSLAPFYGVLIVTIIFVSILLYSNS